MVAAKSMTTRQRHTEADRGLDLYQTPGTVTRALMRAERLPYSIWEASCGRGAIVRVLRSAGHDVLATDLQDYNSPDQDYGNFDFLQQHTMPYGDLDAILQNPPFGRATDFVRHALKLTRFSYFFLRLQFLEGQRRQDVLDKVARIHVFANRVPMMHRDGWEGPKSTSTTAFAWFVFDREHTGPALVYRVWCKG